MTTLMSPCESGKFIAENSEDVTIDMDGVKKVAKLVSKVTSNEGILRSRFFFLLCVVFFLYMLLAECGYSSE